jgi:hypothetical protein
MRSGFGGSSALKDHRALARFEIDSRLTATPDLLVYVNWTSDNWRFFGDFRGAVDAQRDFAST